MPQAPNKKSNPTRKDKKKRRESQYAMTINTPLSETEPCERENSSEDDEKFFS